MPTRTITEELCDVCFGDEKQKETPATDRLHFGWLGKNYVLLACDKHVGKIRDQLEQWSELGSLEQPGATRQRRASSPARTGRQTLFSTLGPEEKERFRAWADMATARRIADARVEEWIAAGKP